MQKENQFTNRTLLKWFLPYVLIASLQFQFTKNGLEYSSPFVLMTFRYLSVGIIFYFVGGRKIPINRDTLLIAAFTSTSSLLWAFGLKLVSPGDSAVLSFTMPLFSIPIAFIVIKERILLRELVGAIVGFSGVIIYSLTLTHGSYLVGAVLTILNAVFWAAYSVYYRKLKTRDPIPMLTTQFLVGSIPMIIGSLFLPQLNVTTNFVIDIVYVIVFTGVVQYYLWNGLLRRGRVGRITTMAFAIPAASILIDSIQTLSAPSTFEVLGAIVMFLGIFVSSWHKGSAEERSTISETENPNPQKKGLSD
jgi:drug/metabolite transporter (DMT)-like permease